MKKVAFVVCMLSWATLAAAGESAGKPAIKVDQAEHDFGLIWSGPSVKHSFKITNTGTAELQIAKVRPACGCTVTGDYPRSLAPGASGMFPFTLNTAGIKGAFNKSITITSNDPTTPELRLALKGEGRLLIAVEPRGAYFGSVYGSQARTRVLTIDNNGEAPLKLAVDPMSSKGPFKCDLVEKVPGRCYELLVTFDPTGRKPGLVESDFALLTNNESMRQVQVNAVATVKSRVEVEPGILSVFVPTSQPSADTKAVNLTTRTLRFQNYGEKPVKALQVTTDDPALQVKLKEETAGRLYSVEVTTPVGYVPPTEGRTITVKTDDPEMASIKVPVEKGKSSGRSSAIATQRRPNPAEEKVGKEAPAFSLTTLAGKSVSEKDLKGAVTVLDFYAPTCGFCKKQLPRVEAIRKEYEAKGVRFLCVTQTMGKTPATREDVIAKMEELGVKAEVAIDEGNAVGQLFGARGYPTMIVVDKAGKVAAANIGNREDLEGRMKEQLDALLAGRAIVMKPDEAPKPSVTRTNPAEEKVGKTAPAFSLTMFSGKQVSEKDLKGAVTVMDFFATNCGFCKKQLPRVEAIRQEYEAKGVRFLCVTQTMGKTPAKQEDVVSKMNEWGIKAEVAIDKGNTVGQLFGARGYPTMVIVDKSGKIAKVIIGNKEDLEAQMKTQLDSLLKEKDTVAVSLKE